MDNFIITQQQLLPTLKDLLAANSDKRIVVVGATCCGKSTLLKQLSDAHDMDELIFPLLTPEEKAYVCQTPWTEEIGETMDRLVKERITIKPGQPVFGTVVIDSDLVIKLKLSDELLKEKTAKRKVNYEDAVNMQRSIEDEIRKSGIQSITIHVR